MHTYTNMGTVNEVVIIIIIIIIINIIIIIGPSRQHQQLHVRSRPMAAHLCLHQLCV